MNVIEVVFELPKEIADGLIKGTYERMGGVIRERETKQVVAWLREVLDNDANRPKPRSPSISGVANIAARASVLNLAVSTMGFAVVIQRLGMIEDELRLAQKKLGQIERKVDLSFYANFRAAIELASNAFTMANFDNRKASAAQAINRFLEAEQHYTYLIDQEIKEGCLVADKYLATLCLSYVIESRCYLELEEYETAVRRLQKGKDTIRPHFENYVKTLLTSNPSAYLHPALTGQIDLRRLTRIYQWFDPTVDENEVFESQRENFLGLVENPQEWHNSLPLILQTARKSKGKIKGMLPSFSKREASAIFSQLSLAIMLMEDAIETDRRFEMYETEIYGMQQLGIGFQDWLQLPIAVNAGENDVELAYLIPSSPVAVIN